MAAIQDEIPILTRDIVGQFIDWIGVHQADRNIKPYSQRIKIHYQFIGKLDLDDGYKVGLKCECSYSIYSSDEVALASKSKKTR